MIDKYAILEELLEAMVADNETITARAVTRRSDGLFKHASDLTRNSARSAMVERYSKKQKTIRSAVERSSGKSRLELERLVATKNDVIEQLRAEKELLIGSHRAMILSVAEMGGFSRWKRFFDHYQDTIDQLEKMGSLPKAVLIPLPSKRGS